MVNEGQSPKDAQVERARIAGDFRKAVEKGLEPITSMRAAGFIPLFGTTSHEESSGNDDIRYMRFSRNDTSRGVQGLDFLPTHAVEINPTDKVFGNTIAQVMFGLRKDAIIVRAYFVRTPAGGSYLPLRELDLIESQALVDFITDPEQNADRRPIIMELTEDEERAVMEIVDEGAEAEKTLVEAETANAAWHKAAQKKSQDVRI
jgi:hypothetical protein